MPQNADGIIYKKNRPGACEPDWALQNLEQNKVCTKHASSAMASRRHMAQLSTPDPIPRVNQMTNCSLLFLCFHGCFIAFPMSTQPASESKTSAWYLQGAPERVRCKISCPIWSGALLGAQYQIHDRDPKKMMDDQQTSNLP